MLSLIFHQQCNVNDVALSSLERNIRRIYAKTMVYIVEETKYPKKSQDNYRRRVEYYLLIKPTTITRIREYLSYVPDLVP